MKKYAIIFLLFTIHSCTAKKHVEQTAVAKDSLPENRSKQDSVIPLNKQTGDTVIVVKFEKDSIATTINGELKPLMQHISVYIKVNQGKQLTAFLQTPDPNANIRFNQIYTPDGNADGPFGKELVKPVLKKGIYKIIIGRNLMAEGSLDAKFSLRVIVQ